MEFREFKVFSLTAYGLNCYHKREKHLIEFVLDVIFKQLKKVVNQIVYNLISVLLNVKLKFQQFRRVIRSLDMYIEL